MVRFLLIGLFLIVAAGCATTTDDTTQQGDGTSVEDRNTSTTTSDGTDSGVETRGLSDAEKYSIEALSDPNSPLSVRTVYFAFDSSEITPESSTVLIEHARFLTMNPDVQVILEGHTDERGTRDYNLALGERRGKSVHEFLSSEGVAMNQMEVVSFGEEQPVAAEHDESAWQMNRRVEIIYPAR